MVRTPKGLRYLIVISYFPPRWRLAGAELQALLFAQYLAKQGFEVHVVTRSERVAPYVETLGSIVVHRILYVEPRLLRAIYYLCSLIEIVQIRPHIIHAFGVFPSGLLTGATGRILKKPVIVECIGSDVLLVNPIVKALFWKFIFGASQMILAETTVIGTRVSKATKREVDCIPNGVDTSKFNLKRQECRELLGLGGEEKSILYVGRLDPVKDLETLIIAFSKLRNVLPNVRLTLVGKGPELDRLNATAIKNDVAEYVDFLGAIDHDQIPRYMIAADVFVLPSRSEGSPNVILEALAAGTPIIATRVGGIPDLITDGKQGFLYSPGSVAELTGLLLKMLQTTKLRESLSAEAKSRARTYSINLIYRKKLDRILDTTSRYFEVKRSRSEP